MSDFGRLPNELREIVGLVEGAHGHDGLIGYRTDRAMHLVAKIEKDKKMNQLQKAALLEDLEIEWQ